MSDEGLNFDGISVSPCCYSSYKPKENVSESKQILELLKRPWMILMTRKAQRQFFGRYKIAKILVFIINLHLNGV